MTANSLYKIMDRFSAYDNGVHLTVDGKTIDSVTVTFNEGEGFDDYYVTAIDIHTAKDEVCAA